MSKNPISHIDLVVPSLEQALPFYEKILPALGYTRSFHSPKWKVFAAEGELPGAAYFAITENPEHQPNANLIGFWGTDRQAVNDFAQLVQASGGKLVDGPRLFPISPSYYSVYFEDPCGNRYEFLHRLD